MSPFDFLVKPNPAVTANSRSGEEYTVAIGAVPGRTDEIASLHVGPSWVLLNRAEFEALIESGRLIFDRREALMLDTGERNRLGDHP